MTSRVISTDADLEGLFRLLENQKKPFTISVAKGKKRSVEQNRLQRLWMKEIAAEMVDRGTMEWADDEKVRAFCKLHIGVPILRAENEDFREKYDRIIKPHSYEEKLEMMAVPLDFPVTRLMSTEQKTRYLNEVHRYFGGRGFALTDPDPMGRAA